MTQSPLIGVSFDCSTAIPSIVERARAAEAAGASTLWIASHLFQREPFSVAALVLSATSRIRVALMSVSPYMVHPVYAAMAAATLDESFPARVLLCLGTGAPDALKNSGLEATRPVDTLREALDVTRALLAGGHVKYNGEVFRVNSRSLIPGRRNVPIFLSATGPRMLELAGAAADGVVLSAASSVEFVRWAISHADRGAHGRRLQRVALVYASVSDRLLDRFRRTLTTKLPLPHHGKNVELAGSMLDREALARAVAEERWSAADALVGDEVVRKHSVTGSAAEVRDGILAYERAGIDEVVIAGTQDVSEMTGTITAALRRE